MAPSPATTVGAFRMLSRARFILGTRRQAVLRRIVLRRRLAFYRRFVQPGDLCFDVGASIGDRTGLFLRLGARVVAVEPQSACQYKLQRAFEGDSRVTLVASAVGAAPGTATIFQPQPGSVLSSLSERWIAEVRRSGRFAGNDWSGTEEVPVTTLDVLIDEFGLPTFCKIDVEGYEHEVLRGLSRPIPALSLEFVPETLAVTSACLERLTELGAYEFNLSLRESLKLEHPDWTSADGILERLRRFESDHAVFGDVYARVRADT